MVQGFHSDDMVQGFHSDDENFFVSNGGVHVAAYDASSLLEKSLCLCSSKHERIFHEDPIETGTQSHSTSQFIQVLVKPNLYKKIHKIPPLNLKLENWQSLAVEIEAYLSKNSLTMTRMNQNSTYNHEMTKPKGSDFVSQQMTEKLKASNFPALVLKIGSWLRVTRHEGDLVAKCYYAKKKLVWEFLEKSLKRKIEIQWADIVGIKATIEEHQPGILELELKQPPTFHHEVDPQPRKHTNWRVTEEFTEGQALMWRRHYLKFPEGVLDKHFEKLLQCDSRLFELSLKPFPTLDCPYFQPTSINGISEFSLNFSGEWPQMYHGSHFSHSHMNHPSLYSAQQVQSYQPTMQMQPCYSIKDSSSPDSAEDNPGMRFWGEATNNFPANQVQGHFTIASTTPPVVSYQSNNYTETGSRGGGGGDLYDQMLIDSKRASYEALINQANCISAGSDMEFSINEHSNVAWMLPQTTENIHWLPAQATQEMPMSQRHRNSLLYQMTMREDYNGDNKYTR